MLVYEGGWAGGKYHGLGKTFGADGAVLYDGQWRNGSQHDGADEPPPRPAKADSGADGNLYV